MITSHSLVRAALTSLWFLCRALRFCLHCLALSGVAREAAWAMKQRQGAIGILVYPHAGFDVMTTMMVGGDLQREVTVAHAVVIADDARLLQAQGVDQVGADKGDEGGT